jgi:hypothetical protein
VLYVQYRLAGPNAPFPAAVQDLLTSYHYVLDLGVTPENITLVGDSAGGNVVIAFLRYLETGQSLLPRPGNNYLEQFIALGYMLIWNLNRWCAELFAMGRGNSSGWEGV